MPLPDYQIIQLPFLDVQASRSASSQNKRAEMNFISALDENAGSDLLSHTVSHAVPSAVAGLTSVFGMGTGVTLLL